MLGLPLHAQRPWALETTFKQGGFYTHSTLLAPLTRPIRSMDLSLSLPTDGTRYWQYIHHNPDRGLRFSVRDMGNTGVYGYVFSLVPYLHFYPWKTEKAGLGIAHGTGLCYISKIHSPKLVENHLISSHLNAASFLNAAFYYKITPAWRLAAVLEFSHESNGNFKRNNRGFNVWSAGLTLRRHWNGTPAARNLFAELKPVKCWLFSTELAAGMHDYDAESKQLELTPELSAALLRQHNDRFRTYAGLGYSIYPASSIAGAAFIYLGEEVMLGALSVRYSLGTYLAAERPEPRWIGKVGIGYYPFQKSDASFPNPVLRGMYFGAYLKAHGSVAAHVEFTVGNVF